MDADADLGQPLDYPVDVSQGEQSVNAKTGDRSNLLIHVDYGKGLLIIALCAAICGISVPFSLWSVYQAQVMTTEYRVELNHRMEMEAEQRSMRRDLEAMTHGHR